MHADMVKPLYGSISNVLICIYVISRIKKLRPLDS